MPIAIVHLGTKVTDEIKGEIAKEAMKILSEVIGKPIKYCSSQVFETIGGFGGEVEPRPHPSAGRTGQKRPSVSGIHL